MFFLLLHSFKQSKWRLKIIDFAYDYNYQIIIKILLILKFLIIKISDIYEGVKIYYNREEVIKENFFGIIIYDKSRVAKFLKIMF